MPLSLAAILLGLSLGLAIRHTQKPPTPPPSTSHQSSTQKTPAKSPSTTSFPDNPNPISPGAQEKAELYLFLHQASPAELLAHWQALLADPDHTQESLADFAALWISRDPASALRHLSDSKFPDLYWWTLARHDPQKALAQVNPADPERYSQVIHAIGTIDPDLAISLLKEELGPHSITALGGIIAGLFNRDPREALDFAFQHRSRQNYHLHSHLMKWAAHSPHDAFAWTLAHTDLHSQNLPALGSLLFEKDPAFITAAIAELPTGKAKAELLTQQAIHLAQSDPHAAFAFAKNQTPFIQLDLLKRTGHTLAKSDPALALQTLSDIFKLELNPASSSSAITPEDTSSFSVSVPVTIYQWAKDLIRQDPQAVLEVAHQADAQASPSFSTSRQVLSTWLNQNSTAAQEWLGAQPPGNLRDHLTSEALSHLPFDDPENLSTHLNLSQQIQNPTLRQQTLNDLFNEFAADYRDGLDALLEDHQFTPAQQKAYDQRSYN